MNKVFAELNTALEAFNSTEMAKSVDFQKQYLYSIITHSTAIEGSTLSESENTLMFDNDIAPVRHNVTEQMMNLDLKRAYDYATRLLDKKSDITVNFLKQLSALVMRNTGSVYNTAMGSFDSSAGDLRMVNVSAGRCGKSYISYQKVPQRLEDFCLWLNEERRKRFADEALGYALSFEAHYRLVTIHPWIDGNGRLCRLLMNMIQMEQGLLPSLIKKEHKDRYIEALSLSQDKGDSSIFVLFMMKSVIKNIAELRFSNSVTSCD